MIRILFSLGTLAAACYGLLRLSSSHPEIRGRIDQFLHTGTFHTLEIRYTADQIMQSHRKDLLKSNRHQFLEPSLKFYPYLLLEVKYPLSPYKTKESVMLWDLTDGEMVISTNRWEKTHGFSDCINAHVDLNEFKIIRALAEKGGFTDRESLSREVPVNPKLLDSWLESCRRKKLILSMDNHYRLHLENPRLKITPCTKLDERLVTKNYHRAECLPKRFSFDQIERVTQAAFGTEFAIRTTIFYLPVHCIVVQNPDGSIHPSHWNTLNGKRLVSAFFN